MILPTITVDIVSNNETILIDIININGDNYKAEVSGSIDSYQTNIYNHTGDILSLIGKVIDGRDLSRED